MFSIKKFLGLFSHQTATVLKNWKILSIKNDVELLDWSPNVIFTGLLSANNNIRIYENNKYRNNYNIKKKMPSTKKKLLIY